MTPDSEAILWHKRYSYLNYRTLNIPSIKISSIKISEQACGTCLIGKQTRLALHSTLPMRATQVLNGVHSHVCRPMDVSTYDGNRYFITFVD
jgi:hypothetical protein